MNLWYWLSYLDYCLLPEELRPELLPEELLIEDELREEEEDDLL